MKRYAVIKREVEFAWQDEWAILDGQTSAIIETRETQGDAQARADELNGTLNQEGDAR